MPDQPKSAAPHPVGDERRAIVRIDGEPSGKKFQGVWLEFADDKRWVVDYRPREMWKSFEDRDVLVTGYCYEPFGQAINAPHFHVESMKFVKPEMGRGPILEIGPELELRGGMFRDETFPSGSKLAGSSVRKFSMPDGGGGFGIQGSDVDLPENGKRVLVVARVIKPDMSWTAQTGGDKIWIVDVREENAPSVTRKLKRCP